MQKPHDMVMMTTILRSLDRYHQWTLQPWGKEGRELRSLVRAIEEADRQLAILEELSCDLTLVDSTHIRSKMTALFFHDEMERVGKDKESNMLQLLTHFHDNPSYWKTSDDKLRFAQDYFDYLQFYFAENEEESDDDEVDEVDEVDEGVGDKRMR